MASALAEGRGDEVRKAIFPGLDTELEPSWSDSEVPSLFDFFVGTLKLSAEKAETACRKLDMLGCTLPSTFADVMRTPEKLEAYRCSLSEADEAGPGLGGDANSVVDAIANGDLERVLSGKLFDTQRSSFEHCPAPHPASGSRTETRAWNTLWMHVEGVTLPELRQKKSEDVWKAHFVLPPDSCPGIDALIIFYRKDKHPVFMGAQQKAWRSELDDT